MSVRRFGILVLVLVGVLPLAVAGLVMIRRAEETALAEVRVGNARVAARAATRLAAYVNQQETLLRTIATSIAPSVGLRPEQLERVAKNYRIAFPHLRSLDVVGREAGCRELATSRLEGGLRERCGEPAVDAALAGRVYRGEVALSPEFAPLMTFGVRIDLAGEPLAAVVAELDMVGIWEAVKEVRVGAAGYARLVTATGTLVAHGDPEERRRVFLHEKDPFLPLIRAAPPADGARYRDSQGRDVIALAAAVPELGWTVIVEQPVAEAFRSARAMRRDLMYVIGAALVVAVFLGLLAGRAPIRAIESMRRHAREVARGNLDARVPPPRLEELRSLAVALNDMAGQLKRLHEEIRAKERLSTFARVAAGLAHDLQTPIESVRGACDIVLQRPDDERARAFLRSAAEQHLPRLHRYVSDLRRLAHDGKVPLELQTVDPRALADSIVRDARGSLKWHGIEFVAEGRAERVWADESLLTRAVSNLVANAADACVARRPPRGTVTVRVRDDEEDVALVIEVADTGLGIAPDRLTDLLVNDFKSDKRSSGVGLGLGVARHVAAAHGGVVSASSVEGEGSTFRIRIPRQAAAGIPAELVIRKGGDR